jgi:glutathione S-transferase
MIDLYSTATPNGHKVHILLEELGLPYRVHHIDIGAGDQFKSDFLAISPNNKIPAIVDADGPDGMPMSLFESGAILLYLASKSGRFLGTTDREKFVDVSDGWRRSDARTGAPLPHLRTGKIRVRLQSLHQRSQALIWRDE